MSEHATPAPASAAPAAGARDPVIEVRGLWSIFGGQGGAPPVVVHRDLNLTVHRGEILSIVGGSGTGKTVLLRRILGLDAPSRGSVTVLGQPATAQNQAEAAARVGMLFQHGALFTAFNVLDNIATPLRERRVLPPELVREAALLKLRMVGLKTSDALKMPADLSGGMIKRAALARALMMDPPLLLLDEPTAGLDPEASDAFCALLRELHAELGLTVVMVTHDLDTLFELSTRVAVLADQHVLVSGSLAEVSAFDHPFIRDYFHGPRALNALALLERKRGHAAAKGG